MQEARGLDGAGAPGVRRAFAAAGMALLMVLTGCIGDGGLFGGDDLGAAEPRDTESQRAEIELQGGFLGECQAAPVDRQVATEPPEDFSAARVELVWTTETMDQGLGHVRLTARATVNNATASQNTEEAGYLGLWIREDDWTDGPLVVEYCADPHGENPNLLVLAEATLYVTLFTGGTPAWNYTAV